MRISDWSSDVCSSDLSDFQLGMMQGLAFAVSFSLFALPIGALVDRCARRWILFAGVLFWGAATVGTGLARTVYEMFAARLARKSVVSGTSVSVRVDLGGRLILKKKNNKTTLSN